MSTSSTNLSIALRQHSYTCSLKLFFQEERMGFLTLGSACWRGIAEKKYGLKTNCFQNCNMITCSNQRADFA